MGNYNPRAPYILGQELVPIQDLDLVFDPNANSVEYGTTFRLDSTVQLGSARFYVQGPVPQPALRQCALINVYPANIADKSGPVNQVIIPCTSVSTTGTGVVVSGANATDALYNPSDSGFVQFVYNSSLAAQYLAASFNTNAYTLLGDKRILNVSLLYTGFMSDVSPDDPSVSVATEFINPNAKWQSLTVLEQVDDAGRVVQFFAPSFVSNTGALVLATSLNNAPYSASAAEEFEVLSLGDVNNFWLPGADPNVAQRTNLPWNYTDLLKFENGALTAVRQRLRVSIALPTTPGSPVFTTFPKAAFRYMALRVTYCNETRSAFGSKEFVYNIGANTVPMYDRNRNTNPILTPGDYVATLSFVDSGATDFGENLNGVFPDLNAIRELYTIPSHQSIQLNVPFPLDETVIGKTFEEETTHVLPQLSLHASGGAALLEPQVYGRQAVGQVYGSFTVTQEVHDALAGSVGTWPWIRFYARRFGHTSVPLSVTVAGGSAYITPEEFDELEQLTTDNWREVTLELSPAPSMGGGTIPQIVWSATGELAGNRWEVLGCAAPAISGLAGTLVLEVPTIQRLGPATYGQPVSGSTINMAWLPQLGPYVTGTVDDNSADMSFILSQTPPPVTGLTATALSQAITGIGKNCGIDPCCIPSEIYYTELTWDSNIFGLMDQFGRTLTDSWGDPDYGPTYTALLNTAAIDVDDGEGLITQPSSGSSPEGAVIPITTSSAVDITATLRNRSGGAVTTGLYGRRINSTNFYFGSIEVNSLTSITINIYRTVAGVTTSIASKDITLNPYMTTGTGSAVRMRFLVDGTALKLKVWAPGSTEPLMWDIETTDSNLSALSAGSAAVFARSLSGSPVIVGVSDLEVTPPTYWFGSYELQRRDTVETDWQTIMKATNPALRTFNDFESRPGIVSEYRIRRLNYYEFYSTWSTEVSGMVPSPGVYGGCLTPGHLLIFTTNEIQDGSSNLAYSSVWLDRQVEETFAFPEAGFVQMQAVYDRDFYIAFRPLERGGEQFQRTVLVQAAAIAPETLGDFTSLRNMAWANVNYVCVRDEDGNRWFAHVGVPSGNVLRNRKLYLAPVQITEVTATPTPVDPSPWS